MRLRSAARHEPTPWSWACFPAEIRFMILDAIATQKNPGWGSYAAVCKEWNEFLEPRVFRKLNLRVPSLEHFPHIVPCDSDKRLLVQHICLNIELPRYKPKCCSNERAKPVNIGKIVHSAVSMLFTILAEWKREGDLALELNVYSPSDCEHWFRNIYLSSDNTEDTEDTMTSKPFLGMLKNKKKCHDPQRGWDETRQINLARESAATQLFRPIDLIGTETHTPDRIPILSRRQPRPTRTALPNITAVTSFIIRRQLRRYLLPFATAALFTRVQGLEAIWYEPWQPYNSRLKPLRVYDIEVEIQRFQVFPSCLDASIARTVRSLVIFQDSTNFYDNFGPRSTYLPSPADPFFNPGDEGDMLVRGVLAQKSVGLYHMAVAFLVTAEEIFASCKPTLRWPHLESLALTSPSLSLSGCDKLEALLCRAATLVPRMPSLRTLVLWNGDKGNACAFIYQRHGEYDASITWRGNWLFLWTPRILAAWRRLATTLGLGVLDTKQERVEADIHSHGDAIHYLQLPCPVITPESLWQIRREAAPVGVEMQYPAPT